MSELQPPADKTNDGKCCICGKSTPKFRYKKRGRWHQLTCSTACMNEHRRRKMVGNTYRRGHKPAYSYPKGNVPWNKGVKGLHQSPQTEFKKGHTTTNKLPVGSVTQRRDKYGTVRAFRKVAEPNKWVPNAVWVWNQHRGEIPKGYVLHHDDGDALNDSIENLKLLTRAEHLKAHEADLAEAKKRKATDVTENLKGTAA